MATQQNLSIIKIVNPPIENETRTYLTTDVATAETVLSTVDNTGFVVSGTDDYYTIIGEYGNQKPEIVLVDADGAGTSNTGFTIGALKFSHEASDPVTFMRYNQIQIYGATETGGTKTLITIIDIDPSEKYTTYSYDGTTYTYFYTAYYNAKDDEISSYSDEITSASFTRRSIKRIIEAGLRKALTKIDRTQDSALNWDVAIEIVQDGTDEILAAKRKWSFLRAVKSDTQTVASTAYISKPDDLSMLEFLIVDNLLLEPMTKLQYNKYVHDGVVTTASTPTHFIEKNNKFYLLPTPNSTYDIIYEYFKIPATITSDLSTEIDFPFVPILIHYCAAHFSWIRGNDKRGDKMYKLFQNLLDQQVVEYSGPEQTGMAESIEQTSIYNDNNIMSGNFRG